MQDSLLRLKSVISQTGLSRSEVYRREARGQFPRRIKIGVRAVAWRQSEISAYVAGAEARQGQLQGAFRSECPPERVGDLASATSQAATLRVKW